ncbi:MAG: hypothetical protein IPN49_13170 [Saprospiraceae bacterium]|nr:hypothetical protein [Saprospiraceae bacterium]MBK8819979.1 hypothetical protein [Saprospiraceae bacterium]
MFINNSNQFLKNHLHDFDVVRLQQREAKISGYHNEIIYAPAWVAGTTLTT